MYQRLLVLFGVLLVPGIALAETWTPLIAADAFSGIRTDVITAVGAILGLALIVFGLGILIRATGR